MSSYSIIFHIKQRNYCTKLTSKLSALAARLFVVWLLLIGLKKGFYDGTRETSAENAEKKFYISFTYYYKKDGVLSAKKRKRTDLAVIFIEAALKNMINTRSHCKSCNSF